MYIVLNHAACSTCQSPRLLSLGGDSAPLVRDGLPHAVRYTDEFLRRFKCLIMLWSLPRCHASHSEQLFYGPSSQNVRFVVASRWPRTAPRLPRARKRRPLARNVYSLYSILFAGGCPRVAARSHAGAVDDALICTNRLQGASRGRCSCR